MKLPNKRDLVILAVKVIALALLALGIFNFYQANAKNLNWCVQKAEYCSIARLNYQEDVAKEVEKLGQ